VQSPELQLVVTVSIAVASVIVVPALVAIARRLYGAWHEAQQARLAKAFVLREELERKFSEMKATQTEQHAENREFMDTIRTEAHRREEKILASIDRVGARVDRVFERIPGGRHS